MAYWNKKLTTGADLVVPEQRVYDAERNLLIQNLQLSWRYSLGNAYAHFSWELLDVGEVMGAYGYPGVERAILDKALRAPTLFPNRSAGERMVGSSDYLRRFGDTNFVDRVTPRFRRDIESFGRQLDASAATGLLRRERYGADIRGPIYGLHAQVLALQGLRATADLWTRTSRPLLAAQATAAADRLEAGLAAPSRRRRSSSPTGRCSSRSSSWTGWSTPTTPCPPRSAAPTGTWSCRTCSPPGSSGPGAPRRQACCATC